VEYIATRLARAGMRDQTALPADVLLEVHKRTQGIPRLINLVSDNLLLTAFAMSSHQATVEMLDEVTRDMELDWPGSGKRFSAPPSESHVETAPA
jgi:general secretion pathway protein A